MQKNSKELITAARQALDAYQKHETAVAELSETHNKLVAAGSLDAASIRKFAEAHTGLELAKRIEPNIERSARAAVDKASREYVYASSTLSELHDRIDAAIEEQALRDVPENLRDGLNVRRTKRHLAEQEARGSVELQPTFRIDRDDHEAIKGVLTYIVETCEALETERARATGVAKKLGVSV